MFILLSFHIYFLYIFSHSFLSILCVIVFYIQYLLTVFFCLYTCVTLRYTCVTLYLCRFIDFSKFVLFRYSSFDVLLSFYVYFPLSFSFFFFAFRELTKKSPTASFYGQNMSGMLLDDQTELWRPSTIEKPSQPGSQQASKSSIPETKRNTILTPVVDVKFFFEEI